MTIPWSRFKEMGTVVLGRMWEWRMEEISVRAKFSRHQGDCRALGLLFA